MGWLHTADLFEISGPSLLHHLGQVAEDGLQLLLLSLGSTLDKASGEFQGVGDVGFGLGAMMVPNLLPSVAILKQTGLGSRGTSKGLPSQVT